MKCRLRPHPVRILARLALDAPLDEVADQRQKDGVLIYMSRAAIPSPKKKNVLPPEVYKHVAIIAFEPPFLKEFLDFGMTMNEEIEGIDYNRVVEMGREMKVLVTNIVSDTVDTPEDLERVRKTMKTDHLWTSGAYAPKRK